MKNRAYYFVLMQQKDSKGPENILVPRIVATSRVHPAHFDTCMRNRGIDAHLHPPSHEEYMPLQLAILRTGRGMSWLGVIPGVILVWISVFYVLFIAFLGRVPPEAPMTSSRFCTSADSL